MEERIDFEQHVANVHSSVKSNKENSKEEVEQRPPSEVNIMATDSSALPGDTLLKNDIVIIDDPPVV